MALSVFLVSALRSSPPIDEAAFAQTGASE
jgi:hypothetical protein